MSQYRYGFNGKENDNEVKGEGNQQDYGFRIYDPRIGKFLSVDPLTRSYPHYTPYQFSGNTPIQAIDLDGAEEYHYTWKKDDKGKPTFTLISQNDIIDNVFVGYRAGRSLFNDAPVPVYERRMNQRKQYVLHGTRELPIDVNGGMNADKPYEWRSFEMRTFYRSYEDMVAFKNGESSSADWWNMRMTAYSAAVKVDNAGVPAGGLGNSRSVIGATDNVASEWVDDAGKTIWPKNDGFAKMPENITLKPGTRVDRFGYEGGTFVAPEGVAYEQRALAPGTAYKPYNVYQVVKPLDVKAGPSAPWFGEPGGGMQFKLGKTIKELVNEGFLKRTK